MNESITYRGAKISDLAAEMIADMQEDPQYKAQVLDAMSDAINQTIISSRMNLEDEMIQTYLISLAMVSNLMKALLMLPVKDEL